MGQTRDGYEKLNFIHYLFYKNNMATNRPQGDLVGWRIDSEVGKTIDISFLDEKL